MLSIPTRYVNTHTLIYQQQTTCQITSSVIISVLSAYVFIDVTALDLFYLHIDFFSIQRALLYMPIIRYMEI